MNTANALCLVAVLGTTLPALAQQGIEAPSVQTRTGRLQCGDTQIVAETQYLDVPGHDRQVLAQTLSLSLPGQASSIRLAHDGRVFRQPFLKHTAVLDAAVTGWACLAANDDKPYLYLSYTCTESPARPRCVGTLREWARLFDTTGKPLNARAPRSGPRTPTLMKKLGLARYLSEGVSLSDIDE